VRDRNGNVIRSPGAYRAAIEARERMRLDALCCGHARRRAESIFAAMLLLDEPDLSAAAARVNLEHDFLLSGAGRHSEWDRVAWIAAWRDVMGTLITRHVEGHRQCRACDVWQKPEALSATGLCTHLCEQDCGEVFRGLDEAKGMPS